MAKHTLFYSWQSDLPNSTNRGFIEDCLQRAIKKIRADEELKLDPCLDRDTSGVPGSPDIAATIFEKIKAADIFVGDVSFINQGATGRPTPNPNVLVELGYAAGRLGWDQIICVFNKATGSIDDLPFDIRPRRVRAYELVKAEEKAEQRNVLVSVLKADITDILHAPDKPETEARQGLLSTLASELISVLILGDEIEERSSNPWIDSLRGQFSEVANSLRHMAISDTAIRHGLATELEELASALDAAVNLRLHFENWADFEGLVRIIVEKAATIKQTRIDGDSIVEKQLPDEVKNTINMIQRKLTALAARAEDMANQGRLPDLLNESSHLGHTLLRLAHHNTETIQCGLGQRLRQIGRDLHIGETVQVYDDEAIVEWIKKNCEELAEILKAVNKEP